MNPIHSLWGSGKGPLKTLLPHVRIASAILLVAAGLVAPLDAPERLAVAALITLCWCAFAGLRLLTAVHTALASAVLFLPLLLLTPWMTVDPLSASPMTERIFTAGAMAFRGTCCLFIAVSTVTAVSLNEVHEGLCALPLPRPVAVLIVQIVVQAMFLTEETVRIVAALRLRAASRAGRPGVLLSFPVVWMVRILFRAERTAAAMTIRGYGVETAFARMAAPYTAYDVLAIVSAAVALVSAVFIRIKAVI